MIVHCTTTGLTPQPITMALRVRSHCAGAMVEVSKDVVLLAYEGSDPTAPRAGPPVVQLRTQLLRVTEDGELKQQPFAG